MNLLLLCMMKAQADGQMEGLIYIVYMYTVSMHGRYIYKYIDTYAACINSICRKHINRYEWIDGWMDGLMEKDGQIDGQMDRIMDIIVYIPYIVSIHRIHTPHTFLVRTHFVETVRLRLSKN